MKNTKLTAELPAVLTEDVLASLKLLPSLAAQASATTQAFPVGSLFWTATNQNPASILGFGRWELVTHGELVLG